MRAIDLHAHTNRSDGQFSPTELVKMAADRQLAALAVTDHDTTAGLEEAMEAGKRFGVEIVPGMEFSTRMEHRDVHLVCLYPETDSPALHKAIQTIQVNRDIRNHRIVEQLNAAGIPLTWEEASAGAAGVMTRGNLAQALVDKGLAASAREAIERFISPGKPGYVEKICPHPSEAIALMHEAGALVFLAHFHQIDRRDLSRSIRMAREILEMGADGLETRYSEFDTEKQAVAESLAEEYGLLRSGGSDFHGRLKPGLSLGTGYGDLFVPYSYLERIREHRFGTSIKKA